MGRIDRKYIERLKKLQRGDDVEVEHSDADDILCELLTELTYTEVVDEYKKIEKWYS